MFSKRFYDNILELIISKHTLSIQAHYDHVTGLANRTTLYDRLSLEISKIQRHNNSASLFFIDMDNFKNINDSYGHNVGDEVLKKFSDSIHSLIRAEDTLARVGGDEFIILLSNLNANREEVIQVTQKLSDKIHTKLNEPINVESHLLNLSVSIGIEIIDAHNLDINTVIKNADTAMYKSKKNGKNQTSFFQQ
ncbi:MAG: GGDEF domain-containing protein [Sulfurimonas sp.]